jgi:hypothetical protein
MHELLTVAAVAALTVVAYLGIASAAARARRVSRPGRTPPCAPGAGRPVPAAVYVEATEFRKAG